MRGAHRKVTPLLCMPLFYIVYYNVVYSKKNTNNSDNNAIFRNFAL